jgi:transcription initiation factor TFIID subunit 5
LATASTDLTIRLWCVVSGKVFRIFTDCRMPTHTVAFSPDGKFLAAAGEETKIRVFDLAAGSQVGEFRSHTAIVRNLVWRPDGKQLVSCCVDGTIRVWDTTTLGTNKQSTGVKTETSRSDPASTVGATSSTASTANSIPSTSNSTKNVASTSQTKTGSSHLTSSFGTGCKKIFRVQFSDEGLNCVGIA